MKLLNKIFWHIIRLEWVIFVGLPILYLYYKISNQPSGEKINNVCLGFIFILCVVWVWWRPAKKFLFLVCPPVFITLFLFNPFIHYELPIETEFIPQSEINEKLASWLLAELFQTSLQLNWYDICIENKNPEIKINQQKLNNKGEVGLLSLQFKEKSFNQDMDSLEPFRTLTAAPNKTACSLIRGNSAGIAYQSGPSVFTLGRVGSSLPLYERGVVSGSLTTPEPYVVNDPWIILVKFFVILLVWAGTIKLCIDTFKWIRG